MVNSVVRFWLRYRFAVYMLTLLSFVAIGAIFLGPFLESPQYDWVQSMAKEVPLVGALIDIEGMLVEKLISSTVPLFLVWGLVLFYYALHDRAARDIEFAAPLLSIFTSGTGTFVASLGGLVLGVCIYGIAVAGVVQPVVGIGIISVALLAGGYYLKATAKPSIEARDWLHKYAKVFGWVFSGLAAVAYVYGVVAEPIELWNTIHEFYEAKSVGQQSQAMGQVSQFRSILQPGKW